MIRRALSNFAPYVETRRPPLLRVRGLPALLLLLLLLGLAISCGTTSDPAPQRSEAEEVVDGSAWVPIAREIDPFAKAMPDAVTSCVSSGVIVEDAMLEMDTGICNFISAETQLTGDVAQGERVTIVLWHLALYADPPAQGVLIIRIGGQEVWRLDVDIPHLEQVYKPEFPAPKSWPKGTMVQVHVHNHGANTWKVYQITAGG
ncbi:MAG: hypothetical protein KC502_07575 [Myxococcales bacterium]|nr:hypothetical protein [Myxococcales bacterium]